MFRRASGAGLSDWGDARDAPHHGQWADVRNPPAKAPRHPRILIPPSIARFWVGQRLTGEPAAMPWQGRRLLLATYSVFMLKAWLTSGRMQKAEHREAGDEPTRGIC